MKEKTLSIKQKMNLEEKTILELLDKILFLNYSDEEKMKILKYIKACRLRYLSLSKELIMEKRKGSMVIDNYFCKSRKRWK